MSGESGLGLGLRTQKHTENILKLENVLPTFFITNRKQNTFINPQGKWFY